MSIRHGLVRSGWICVAVIVMLQGAGTVAPAAQIPFGPQQIITTSNGVGIDVIAGDLDGDGDMDLVASAGTNSPSGVYWHENLDGAATFSGPQVIASDATGLSNRSSIELADMDGDGDLDLLTGYYYEAFWYPNDGLGNFGAPTLIRDESFFGAGYDDFRAADLDGDGDLDVVGLSGTSIGPGDKLVWFENLGGGTFNPTTENFVDALVNGNGTGHVDAADIDGDGDIDLIANESTTGPDRILWYRNTDGAGTFSAALEVYTTPFGVNDVKASDIDGDGDLDIVSVSGSKWHENTAGDGSSWTTHVIDDFNSTSFFVKVVDMDLDGDPDILLGTRVTDEARWIENTSGDGSTWVNRVITGNVDWPLGTVAADFDGDGDPDIATASLMDSKFAWNENLTIHRNAAFDGTQDVIGSGIDGATFVFPVDLDLDGDMDAVSAGENDNTVRWHENDGGTPISWTSRTISTTATGAWSTWADDVDGDGDIDALAACFSGGDKIVWYENDGATPPGWTERIIDATITLATSVRTVDFDGDGDVDVVGTTQGENLVRWYESDGAAPPVWTPRDITTGLANARAADVADLDGDGDLDVMAAGFSSGSLFWYENDGVTPPGWTQRTMSTGLSAPNYIQATDFDGDGDVDAFSVEVFGETLRWHESDGGAPPTFTNRVIDVVSGTNSVWTGHAIDMDQDGDVDALAATSTEGVVWYENSGGSPPTWTGRTIFDEGDTRRGIFAGDMDLDGDADVLVAGNSLDKVYWLENRGGQYGFTGTDADDGQAPEGEATSLIAATMKLNARPGDSVGRLSSIDLLFEDTGSTPLNDTQANALIENLLVYRDTGSGEFEAGADALLQTVSSLSLSAGVETIVLPTGDPNAIVAAPATFFVVAELTADASNQSPADFRVTHLSQTGSVAVDANAGIQLAPEYSPDFLSQTISSVGRFVVTVTTDATDANPGDGVCDDGSGNCTLRAAVMEANALPGDNFISLPAGTYTLSIPGTGEDAAATGDLDVVPAASDWLNIVGQGPGLTIIDGGGLDRVFHVQAARMLSLQNLTVQGGDTTSPADSGAGVRVAGFNNATLVVDRCEFRNNVSAAGGGAIYSSGTVRISNSLFRGNSETGGVNGDAVTNASSGAAFMEIVNSTFSGNVGGHPANGAIGTQGPTPTTIVRGCTLTENTRGISAVNVQVENSIVSGNVLVDISGSSFLSLGHNFVGNTSNAAFVDGVGGDQVGSAGSPKDARLVPLGDNGGPTLTHALKPNSLALDSGSCSSETKDQRGESRPFDLPGAANVDDGCDIGAYESRVGPTQERIEIPVRWCGLRGAPSIEDPSLVGETSVNDVLRKRHERASDKIYTPAANVAFRSAGNVVAENYPLLEDPDCVEGPTGTFTCGVGQRGEVFVNLAEANFDEFQFLITACRRAWEAQDTDIQGVVAVHIDQFVDETGTPLDILGIGGRAGLNDGTAQSVGGRVMVVDNVYRLDVPANPGVPNPPDAIDRLLGHELGHALSLQHGDGIDNDNDGDLDNDDDKTVNLPRFDGTNLMQYRNGTALTAAQVERIRNHTDDTLPDIDVQPLQDTVSDETPIDPELKSPLQFGFNGLTELELKSPLQFELASVLQFENRSVLQFENRSVLQFENRSVLQFENKSVLQFGMNYNGTLPGNRTRISATMAGLPWPAAIRPTTRYFFYLDLDRSDATGGYPRDFANPELPGSNFPGRNNFAGQPDLTEEAGVDLIVQIELSSACPGSVCSSTSEMKVFDFNDGTSEYELALTDPNPDLAALGVELYLDNGGVAPEFDNISTELVVEPELDNSILFAAGWGFDTPGGGGPPVPQRVRMEVVTTVDCVGNVINDDPGSAAVDCQCTDCGDCPDYPGCNAGVGTPRTLNGTTITVDSKLGELTFEPPLLPSCVSIPQLAAEGGSLTVSVTDLPDDVTGTVEVVVGDTVVGTQGISPVDNGTVSISVLLPADVTGPVRLSTGIVGLAPRADCIVAVTPTLGCADNDGDGTCDASDADDDNDGVADGSDLAAFNPRVCRDVDADGCDDCASGTDAPFQDGPDYDLDGLCNAGDPDDDNDGVLDGADGEPLNANACGDSDLDSCDDCVVSFPAAPGNDGPDVDADGLCDFGDIDDDNDGTSDFADCAPLDATLEAVPLSFGGLVLEGGGVRVSWAAFFDNYGSASIVDLVRGDLATLPVGAGAETCLLSGSTAAFYDDATPITPGTGVWYLLRGSNACGAGTYDNNRTTTVCP